jgi:hypothetical protein
VLDGCEIWSLTLREGGMQTHYSVQNTRLLSKNLKIKIYKKITLPVVLHGCET